MSLLLDTSVFLWIYFDEKENLSSKALKKLGQEESLFISAVSIWEIAIKYSSGKLKFDTNPKVWIDQTLREMGLSLLAIQTSHLLEVSELPFHHKDPFDRLLICQSKIEKIPLLSSDEIFKKYDVDVIW